MGVATLWKELDHARTFTTLQKEAWKAFESSPYHALRLGIDASLWLFHIRGLPAQQDEEGGMGLNPELRMLFFRLANLFSLPILPIFVFDGPEKPKKKRGSERGATIGWGSTKLVRDFKDVIDAFGFQHMEAPGEAEAELAWLNDFGLIDAVLTDDVDTLLFGGRKVLRKCVFPRSTPCPCPATLTLSAPSSAAGALA
jgi:holliday junction resolvase YEN1